MDRIGSAGRPGVWPACSQLAFARRRWLLCVSSSLTAREKIWKRCFGIQVLGEGEVAWVRVRWQEAVGKWEDKERVVRVRR